MFGVKVLSLIFICILRIRFQVQKSKYKSPHCPAKGRPVTTAAELITLPSRLKRGTGERQQVKHVHEPLEQEATIDQANTGRVSKIMRTAEMSNGSRFKPVQTEVDRECDDDATTQTRRQSITLSSSRNSTKVLWRSP